MWFLFSVQLFTLCLCFCFFFPRTRIGRKIWQRPQENDSLKRLKPKHFSADANTQKPVSHFKKTLCAVRGRHFFCKVRFREMLCNRLDTWSCSVPLHTKIQKKITEGSNVFYYYVKGAFSGTYAETLCQKTHIHITNIHFQ